MAIQRCFSKTAYEVKIVNENLSIVKKDDRLYFFNGSGPIYCCRTDDKAGIRLAEGMLVALQVARPTELARALGVDQSTVHRNRQKYEDKGVGAFTDKRVIREAYKVTQDKCIQAQQLLDSGYSLTDTAKKIGVSEGAIRYTINQGRLRRGNDEVSPENLKSPLSRSQEAQNSEAGIGVKRTDERTLARLGDLDEAPPRFTAAEAVQHAGVLIALPALLSQGLLKIGQKVYGKLNKGFYGLQSVLLTLAFMALLRIKTPEQLKEHAPGELGFILGLDRVPEVKTLRRKLSEMRSQKKALEFSGLLTSYWVKEQPDTLGFLYIDGHVRPYNGRKHSLAETHVARRRLCMPATTDFWVNDENAEPLFFVTAEANDSLVSMLNNEILPEVRELAGKDTRVTLIFDREGWSPDSFQKWVKNGFDVVTYRKGKYKPWSEKCFTETEAEVCGKKVKYKLAMSLLEVRKGFWLREVRRLCDNGHQTSVVTSRRDVSSEEIAQRMFSRWNQENFFRYMRHEYALDHLCTYEGESADSSREVPNPAVKEKKKEIEKIKKELSRLKEDYGDKALKNDEKRRRSMRGFKIANSDNGKKIRTLESHYYKAVAELKELPKKVEVKEILDEDKIVKLERESKILTDTIKMLSYRAETFLLNLIAPFFSRSDEEGRRFLVSLFQSPADIVPDEEKGRLVVRFHSLSTPRANHALKELCGIVNQESYFYPGTNLRLYFDFP
jgi:transposase-like protein